MSDLLILTVLLGTAAVETILSATWSALYFTWGIPVFQARVAVLPHVLLSADALTTRFKGGPGPSLVFRALPGGHIAFRERLFEFRLSAYTPVMHGVIVPNSDGGEVQVRGLLNWFSVAFGAVALTAFHPRPPLGFFVFFIAIISLIYGVQARRYRQVAKALEHPENPSA